MVSMKIDLFSIILLTATVAVSGEYLGCFEDAGTRLLQDYRMNMNEINTPEKCIHICKQLGFMYAGVEYSVECFCGNKKPDAFNKKSENDCKFLCPHSKEFCGGFWRLAVYKTGSSSSAIETGFDDTVTSLGCYQDAGNRIMADFRIHFNDINSPRRCFRVCKTLGFKYAGVEYGSECFCAHKKPGEEKRTDNNDCTMSCPYSAEKCGGTWRLSVYSCSDGAVAPSIADESARDTFIGCFEDSSNRVLSDYRINLGEINNVRKCSYICRQMGYSYAGVQYGHECFCGNEVPNETKRRPHHECNSQCPHSSEKCGGTWRIAVHTTALHSPEVVTDMPNPNDIDIRLGRRQRTITRSF